MITLTFIIIFFIFGVICSLFLITSLLKLFESIYPHSTYYQIQNQQRQIGSKQYERISQGNQPEKKIDYSIIYTIHRRSGQKIEYISIKHQLEILSTLMKESIKEEEKYEIVCVIDPKNYNLFRYISSLYQDHRYLIPVLKSANGIEYFINGFLHSKGSIVIDSEFIADKIDEIIKIDHDKPFVELIQPKIEKTLILNEENHFMQPVMITRSAGEKIFANLHMTKFGASKEILYLCKYFSIVPQIQSQKIGYTNISLMDIIFTIFNEKVCIFLYGNGYWKIK